MVYFKNKYNNSIAAKLIFYMFLFSLIMVILITSIRTYHDYSEGIDYINYQLQQIKKVFIHGLSASLWDMYEDQLRIQLEGLLHLPSIQYLGVYSKGKLMVFVGNTQSEKNISVKIPMVHTREGKKNIIGELHVIASLDNLYKGLYKAAMANLVINFLLFFIILTFCYFIFQMLVTKHLINISRFFRQQQNLNDLDISLILNRSKCQDELHIVETSINNMQSKLKNSFQELAQYKDRLELLVTERTSELYGTNIKLTDEIKERKNTEVKLASTLEQLKKSQAKLIEAEKYAMLGTLTNGIAHEMNNPMMGILNFIQYCIKHTNKDDKRYHILKDAEIEVKRCLNIVNNLLEISQTEREFNENIEEIDLSIVIKQVNDSFSHLVNQKNITVCLKIDENLPLINAQFNKIKQVFSNLYKNAIEALKDAPKKELHISAQKKETVIQVKYFDTGCGISPEILNKIFDPFYTTKSNWQSTGLGLSTSKTIIENMGSQISVKSKLEAGTEFIVLLPIKIG